MSAVKLVDITDLVAAENMKTELNALKLLRHNNIVSLKNVPPRPFCIPAPPVPHPNPPPFLTLTPRAENTYNGVQ